MPPCVSEQRLETAEEVLEALEALMEDYRVLEAERLICHALEHWQHSGEATQHEEARRVCASPWLQEVLDRCAQYEFIGRQLLADDEESRSMELVWERHDAKVWCRVLPDQQVDVKVAIELAAPLSACLVGSFELDLIPEWNKMMKRAPTTVGPVSKFNFVVHAVIEILLFKLESFGEVLRFVDREYGFYVDSISSEFPPRDLVLPSETSWRNIRLAVDVKSVFLPRGGSQPGTLLVQMSRFSVGFGVPQSMLKHLVAVAAPSMIAEAITAAGRASEPGTVFYQRLQEDKDGLYAELQAAEAVASRRGELSLDTLPGPEIFDRPLELVPGVASTRARKSSVASLASLDSLFGGSDRSGLRDDELH